MLELITSAVQAILQVIVNVTFGVILTKAGYFDSAKQRWLSRVNMVFFTPCLLFSNIASVISFEKLVAFWPIPVFFTLFSLLSWLVGQGMLRLFGVTGPYRRFVAACSLFCNTNSLPIAVISSLAFSEAGSLLYWHENDTQQDVAARGVAYTLFYAMFCNIIRWSYGYSLLQRHSKDTEMGYGTDSNDGLINNSKTDGSDTERHPSTTPYNYTPDNFSSNSSTRSSSSSDTKQDDTLQGKPVPSSRPPLSPMLTSFPKHSNESSPLLLASPASSSTLYTSIDPWTTRVYHRIHQQLTNTALQIHSYMSPPLYSALLALMVGLSPLQPLLFDPHAFLYPSLTKAVQNCGKAAVPLILVCLGSQLTLIAQQNRHSSDHDQHHQNAVAFRRAVIASLVTRMVTPVIVIGLVMVCLNYTTIVAIDLMQDPMFVVAIIILGCTPTAINLSQITQVNGIFEEEMMQVLFWSYGVVCIPVMTMVVFAALALVDKSM
ncbi:auxin efflux carrier [Absidia repens]|uniref:Auxin efflux carrier n=1 Tax=Absidia repens TaxID=90262 RepID=A0A1X2J0W3_9FUNG|nr:auxin efflux carrier [Absidia repens]